MNPPLVPFSWLAYQIGFDKVHHHQTQNSSSFLALSPSLKMLPCRHVDMVYMQKLVDRGSVIFSSVDVDHMLVNFVHIC